MPAATGSREQPLSSCDCQLTPLACDGDDRAHVTERLRDLSKWPGSSSIYPRGERGQHLHFIHPPSPTGKHPIPWAAGWRPPSLAMKGCRPVSRNAGSLSPESENQQARAERSGCWLGRLRGTLGAGYFTWVPRGLGLPASELISLGMVVAAPRRHGDTAWGGTGLFCWWHRAALPVRKAFGDGAVVNHPSACLQLWVVL